MKQHEQKVYYPNYEFKYIFTRLFSKKGNIFD